MSANKGNDMDIILQQGKRLYQYFKIKVFFVLTKNVSFCFRAEKIYDKMSKDLESKDLEG